MRFFILAPMARLNGCLASLFFSPMNAIQKLFWDQSLIYPFIVTDPGEAAHAKRRSGAVIIGHLTPKLTSPKLTASVAQIETLLDEYSQAVSLDPRRAKLISAAIIDEAKKQDLFQEAGVTAGADLDETLSSLDKWLCDLKEIRIGDGLHIFGQSLDNEEENASTKNEKLSLLSALEGKFIEPGPGGAPHADAKTSCRQVVIYFVSTQDIRRHTPLMKLANALLMRLFASI